MEELSNWLGPAIAVLWVVFRVIPRLLKSDAPRLEPPPAVPGEGDPPRERKAGEDFGSKPIVPR